MKAKNKAIIRVYYIRFTERLAERSCISSLDGRPEADVSFGLEVQTSESGYTEHLHFRSYLPYGSAYCSDSLDYLDSRDTERTIERIKAIHKVLTDVIGNYRQTDRADLLSKRLYCDLPHTESEEYREKLKADAQANFEAETAWKLKYCQWDMERTVKEKAEKAA